MVFLSESHPTVDQIPPDEPEAPCALGKDGWWRAAQRVWRETQKDRLDLVAAGVAFYLLLALAPALASAVSLYGVFSDPSDVRSLIQAMSTWVPGPVVELMYEQLNRITDSSDTVLSVGALLGAVFTLWSANRGTKALIIGLNVAYDEEDGRSIVRLNLLSLGVSLALLLSMAAAVAFFAMVPVPEGPPLLAWGVIGGRWLALAGGMLVLLAVLYRFLPDRRAPRWRWVSTGSMLALVGWMLASLGFSQYVAWFGSYTETFGALAGVVVTMTWLWLCAYVLLLGAEVNAELEHQTMADSTIGPKRPLGRRGAYVADDVPPEVRRARAARERPAGG